MAVLVNLLPDIKLERLRLERRKRRMLVLGLAVMAVGVGVPIILGAVMAGQQVLLNNTRTANQDGIAQLRSVENINEIITAKNQLDSIYSLRDQGEDMVGMLEVLESSLPQGAKLTSLEINSVGELEITGEAADLERVDLAIKALSSYTPEGLVTDRFDFSSTPYIQNVRVESVEPGISGSASFTIVGQFDFALLDSVKAQQAAEENEINTETEGADSPELPGEENPFSDPATEGAQ